MNIADNLTYLNETKRRLREDINAAFGAELTDADTFRSYADFLNDLWTPELLFRGGEQGAWYGPSDLSRLFQDAAGTTPVTADGDPVGLMLDKSGNGNHASQTVSAERPLYKTDGTAFAGTGDRLLTNLRVNPPVTIAVAIRIPAGRGSMYAFGGGYLNSNTGYGFGRSENGSYFFQSRIVANIHSMFGPSTGSVWVAVATLDSDGTLTLTDDSGTQTTATTLGGLTQSDSICIGRPRVSASSQVADLVGDFHAGVVVNRVLSSTEINDLRTYFKKLAGVTL